MSFDTPSRTPDAETPAGMRRDPSEDVVDDPTAPDAADDEALDEDELDDGFEREDDDADDSDGSDDDDSDDDEESVLYEDQVQPEYGILGFTLRELIIVGSWLVAFVVSFFPLVPGSSTPIWGSGIGWILTIGVPTAAVFLVVLRRFSPQGIRRVGSLGIDQFASVAASVAAVAWIQLLWNQVAATIETGTFLVGWPVIVALLATLALVATTTAAPLFPGLREDFEGRVERLAHRSANPVRPVIARPRPVATTPAAAVATAETAEAETDQAEPVDGEPVEAESVEGEPTAQSEWDQDETHVIPRLDPAIVAPLGGAAIPPMPPSEFAAESDAEDVRADDETGAPVATDADDADRPEEPVAETEEPVAETEEPTAETEAPTTVIDDAVAPRPRFGEMRPEPETSASADDATSVPDTGTEDPAFADSAPIEVYNTGAVEVLQQIFEADGAATPIAMDSTDTGTIGSEHADRPVLRRDRAEQARTAQFEPEPAPVPQPFWILARTERDVLDELGRPLFRIGPTDWTLVIEDRGGAFVVRHEDGRIGYLHDMSDITKG